MTSENKGSGAGKFALGALIGAAVGAGLRGIFVNLGLQLAVGVDFAGSQVMCSKRVNGIKKTVGLDD